MVSGSSLKLVHTVFLFCFVFLLFRAVLVVYGDFQAGGQMGAAAAGLHHSHHKEGSEPHLRPTSQPTAMPGPQPTERGQESNLRPHGYWSDSFPLSHDGNYQAIVLMSFS